MGRFASKEFIEYAVMQYSGMITRLAFQYTRNKADAEDIMQEVFIALLRQPQFETKEHLKAWLIRVSINKSKDLLRSAKRRATVALKHDYPFTDAQSAVFDELQKLPDKDRDILYLFYYEGYSAKEIADILGKKESAIFMHLTRAREKLKNFLEEE